MLRTTNDGFITQIPQKQTPRQVKVKATQSGYNHQKSVILFACPK